MTSSVFIAVLIVLALVTGCSIAYAAKAILDFVAKEKPNNRPG